jgi:hypothetical protein
MEPEELGEAQHIFQVGLIKTLVMQSGAVLRVDAVLVKLMLWVDHLFTVAAVAVRVVKQEILGKTGALQAVWLKVVVVPGER